MQTSVAAHTLGSEKFPEGALPSVTSPSVQHAASASKSGSTMSDQLAETTMSAPQESLPHSQHNTYSFSGLLEEDISHSRSAALVQDSLTGEHVLVRGDEPSV